MPDSQYPPQSRASCSGILYSITNEFRRTVQGHDEIDEEAVATGTLCEIIGSKDDSSTTTSTVAGRKRKDRSSNDTDAATTRIQPVQHPDHRQKAYLQYATGLAAEIAAWQRNFGVETLAKPNVSFRALADADGHVRTPPPGDPSSVACSVDNLLQVAVQFSVHAIGLKKDGIRSVGTLFDSCVPKKPGDQQSKTRYVDLHGPPCLPDLQIVLTPAIGAAGSPDPADEQLGVDHRFMKEPRGGRQSGIGPPFSMNNRTEEMATISRNVRSGLIALGLTGQTRDSSSHLLPSYDEIPAKSSKRNDPWRRFDPSDFRLCSNFSQHVVLFYWIFFPLRSRIGHARGLTFSASYDRYRRSRMLRLRNGIPMLPLLSDGSPMIPARMLWYPAVAPVAAAVVPRVSLSSVTAAAAAANASASTAVVPDVNAVAPRPLPSALFALDKRNLMKEVTVEMRRLPSNSALFAPAQKLPPLFNLGEGDDMKDDDDSE